MGLCAVLWNVRRRPGGMAGACICQPSRSLPESPQTCGGELRKSPSILPSWSARIAPRVWEVLGCFGTGLGSYVFVDCPRQTHGSCFRFCGTSVRVVEWSLVSARVSEEPPRLASFFSSAARIDQVDGGKVEAQAFGPRYKRFADEMDTGWPPGVWMLPGGTYVAPASCWLPARPRRRVERRLDACHVEGGLP